MNIGLLMFILGVAACWFALRIYYSYKYFDKRCLKCNTRGNDNDIYCCKDGSKLASFEAMYKIRR